jgi:hypothetical protein
MAVTSATSSISYTGNASTVTSYAVPFLFLENSHLQAIARTSAGVESTVTLTNHTGAGDVNGGTVRTSVAVPATSTLTIYREVPATQTTQYAEGGDFPAASHERALDKLTFIAQQNERIAERAIRVNEADGARNEMTAVANSIVGLDANRQPKAMTLSEVKTYLALSGVTLDVNAGMKTFADAGERAAAVPDFTGQLGTQRDTGVVYVSTATAAGSWSVVTPAFGSQNVTAARLVAEGGFLNLPSITFAGDGDTGIFHPAEGTMAFSTNNTEKMRIDAGGVETTGNFSGNRLVAAGGTAIAPSITFAGDGNTGIFHPAEATIAFSENATEVMRINSDGDLIVNNTTPVNATTGTADGFTVLTNGQTHLSRNNGISLFLRRRLVDGRVAEFYRDTTAVGGISVTGTAASFNTSSDYRLKENPTLLTGGLATVGQLIPCEFTWKSNGSIGRGFIAHELQAVVPEAVSGEKDAVDAEGRPQYQGVDAAKVVPYLVAAVQELSAKVATLEAVQ